MVPIAILLQGEAEVEVVSGCGETWRITAMSDQGLSLEDQVREFLSQTLGINVSKIRPESRIESNLGATGDDADELMEAFFRRFHVDRRGYSFDRHFHEEGSFGCLLFWRRRSVKTKVELTVADLVKCANEKRWSLSDTTQEALRE